MSIIGRRKKLDLRPLVLILTVASLAVSIAFYACGPTNNLPELTGEYLYVSNFNDGSVSVFSIDSSTGVLTLIANTHVGTVEPSGQPVGMALHWSNEFLFFALDFGGFAYGVDIGDGTFSGQILGEATEYYVSPGTRDLAFEPHGRYLYVTSGFFNGFHEISRVTEFSVNQSNGGLTYIGNVVPGENAFGIAVDPLNGCVYVANTFDHTLSVFTNGFGGNLGLATPSTITLSTPSGSPTAGPQLVAAQSNPGVVSAGADESVYVTDDDAGVVHQLFGPASGCVSGRPVDVAAAGAVGITLHPNGQLAYTANSTTNTISIFSIDASGNLTPQGTISTPNLSDPLSVTIDASGNFLYAANNANGTVAEFQIDTSTGNLTPIGATGEVNSENPANANSQPVTVITTLKYPPTFVSTPTPIATPGG